MTNLNDLIHFDPLAEAERVTGLDYKTDEMTSSLGFGLAIAHNKRLDAALIAADDTGYSSTWDDTLRIFYELGFETILTKHFTGNDRPETTVFLWRAGILAMIESYGDRVNSSKIWYNVQFETTEDYWRYISSGSFVDYDNRIWGGDHDTRIGLRNTLSRLESAGTFLEVWTKRPWLWFLNYMDTKVDGYDYAAINAQIISEFPEHVRAAIGSASSSSASTTTGDNP